MKKLILVFLFASVFATSSISAGKWDDFVAALRRLFAREKAGVISQIEAVSSELLIENVGECSFKVTRGNLTKDQWIDQLGGWYNFRGKNQGCFIREEGEKIFRSCLSSGFLKEYIQTSGSISYVFYRVTSPFRVNCPRIGEFTVTLE